MTIDSAMTYSWLSVLPPLLAIVIAIRTKQVILSLFLGIWIGWTIIMDFNPLTGFAAALEGCVQVFVDPSNTKVILFSAMVGALITFTQYSGGMEGFVQSMTNRGWVNTRKKAGLFAWFVGMVIFVESNISVLIAGAVARPLFDKLRISREKLAYITDSTSAPKCILIPLNAWGAFIIGLLADQNVQNPVGAMVSSMPFNIYAIAAISLVLVVILKKTDWGPMREAERRVREEGKLLRDGAEPLVSADVLHIEPKQGVPRRMFNMLLPVLVMVIMMPVGLAITGNGDIMNGSGSTSVFWAVVSGLVVGAISYRVQKIMSIKEIMDQFIAGVSGLIPMAALMMLAFAIGDVCGELGTGPYVAHMTDALLSPKLVPALLFIVSAFIAFSTGTSWGTFAIMIPIGLPMVTMMDLNQGLIIAAVLGGGVFGDHCSPISDTTIIASMSAATDHIDHVRTQLPYAMTAAAITLVVYLILGFIL